MVAWTRWHGLCPNAGCCNQPKFEISQDFRDEEWSNDPAIIFSFGRLKKWTGKRLPIAAGKITQRIWLKSRMRNNKTLSGESQRFLFYQQRPYLLHTMTTSPGQCLACSQTSLSMAGGLGRPIWTGTSWHFHTDPPQYISTKIWWKSISHNEYWGPSTFLFW